MSTRVYSPVFGPFAERSQRVSPLGVSWRFPLAARGAERPGVTPISMGWAMAGLGILFGGAALYLAFKD